MVCDIEGTFRSLDSAQKPTLEPAKAPAERLPDAADAAAASSKHIDLVRITYG